MSKYAYPSIVVVEASEPPHRTLTHGEKDGLLSHPPTSRSLSHTPHPNIEDVFVAGLWSASSVASLGVSLHRSSTVRPAAAGLTDTNSLLGLRRRSPSPSVSSNDSAVELMPCALTKLEWIQSHPSSSL
ncbi:unnamed protein product [Hydatigera taeniaeformis]|uniref:Uncharacterized protein n=1 Tax=Hydatigena taeniaeformis TaxID=6205 RepID=A0A0R3X302_HYDTA|nr:unnamed protein product [Hydatigera taeniaeformis]